MTSSGQAVNPLRPSAESDGTLHATAAVFDNLPREMKDRVRLDGYKWNHFRIFTADSKLITQDHWKTGMVDELED